ncbi:MAG: DUF1906 domain-containing protein [Actinomycetia bacterium]|nr:DUF1906 domain-containing protein [Actinomycetes bacterium]
MTEKKTFARYLLAGALTLTGLLTPALAAPSAAAAVPGHHHPRTAAARIFQGDGFDTCQAPDLATMDAWRAHSSYRAAGIYFGGRARACSSQRNLTPDWVRQTTGAGWNLLPIYVGSQAPCVEGSNKNPYRIDSSAPSSEGTSEGKDAVGAAQALGIQPGSPLYLDMEAYDISDSACKATTLAYVQAWDRQVHASGYVTGFYSSADSGVQHMDEARAAGKGDLPDVLWYGRWGVTPNVTSDPAISDAAWTPHARIHQYDGSITESHGGMSLNVDRNLVDAPVAVVG